MRYMLVFLLLLAGCYGCGAAIPNPPPASFESQPADIETMRESTAAIVASNFSGDMIVCSAVWIDYGTLLTAAHCTASELAYDDEGRFAFRTYAEIGASGDNDAPMMPPYHWATLIARDEIRDLAMLVTTEPLAHPFVSLGAELHAGEHVHMVGHTAGYPYSWAPGWVSAVRVVEGPSPIRGRFSQVVVEGRGGNSGGGLWDDDGKLVGIASFADLKGWTFFVSRATVASFIAENA